MQPYLITPMPSHDPLFLSWLAGFVDGEGSFSVLRRPANKQNAQPSYFPYLQISQTNRAILEHIQATLGVGRVYASMSKKHRAEGRRRELWSYRLCGRQAQAVVVALIPYIKIKRQQAEVFLSFPHAGTNRLSESARLEQARLHLLLQSVNKAACPI